MSEYGGYAPQHNGGCGTPVVATILLACGMFLVAFAAGGGGGSSTHTTTTEVLSRNPVASNNTVKVFSDNNVCLGDGSCPTYNITQTVTVAGDRNQVQAGMLPVCWDPALSTYTSSACGSQP